MKKIYLLLLVFTFSTTANSKDRHRIEEELGKCAEGKKDEQSFQYCYQEAIDKWEAKISEFRNFTQSVVRGEDLEYFIKYQNSWDSYIAYSIEKKATNEYEVFEKFTYGLVIKYIARGDQYFELIRYYCGENPDKRFISFCAGLKEDLR